MDDFMGWLKIRLADRAPDCAIPTISCQLLTIPRVSYQIFKQTKLKKCCLCNRTLHFYYWLVLYVEELTVTIIQINLIHLFVYFVRIGSSSIIEFCSSVDKWFCETRFFFTAKQTFANELRNSSLLDIRLRVLGRFHKTGKSMTKSKR